MEKGVFAQIKHCSGVRHDFVCWLLCCLVFFSALIYRGQFSFITNFERSNVTEVEEVSKREKFQGDLKNCVCLHTISGLRSKQLCKFL